MTRWALRQPLQRLRARAVVSGSRPSSSFYRRDMGTWPMIRPQRLRAITMDVTGTVVSFRGTLEEHYIGSAQKCGISIPSDLPIAPAFSQAYKEMCRDYPCFGGQELTAKDWWRRCVHRSFQLAGAAMSEEQLEIVFQRIYSRFGSQMAYEKFDDALPFLNWSQRHNILCGVVSNADERYGDSILPMLGITPDTLQFACFSKDFGLEKPDPDFYHAAINRAAQWLTNPSDKLLPSQVLHIGNDFDKDFEGARSAGMHAVLLDRYDESQKAEEWGRLGAPVFTDLIDIVHWIGQTGCRLG